MNVYLKTIIVSIIYYLIYLFLTIQFIPFVVMLIDNSEYHSLKLSMSIGPFPIDYLLMLLLAAISIAWFERHQARKGRK